MMMPITSSFIKFGIFILLSHEWQECSGNGWPAGPGDIVPAAFVRENKPKVYEAVWQSGGRTSPIHSHNLTLPPLPMALVDEVSKTLGASFFTFVCGCVYAFSVSMSFPDVRTSSGYMAWLCRKSTSIWICTQKMAGSSNLLSVHLTTSLSGTVDLMFMERLF